MVALLPTNFLAAQVTLSISSLSSGHAISRVAEGASSLDIVQDKKPFYTAGVSPSMLHQDSLGFRRLVAVWSCIRINDTSVKETGHILCK